MYVCTGDRNPRHALDTCSRRIYMVVFSVDERNADIPISNSYNAVACFLRCCMFSMVDYV